MGALHQEQFDIVRAYADIYESVEQQVVEQRSLKLEAGYLRAVAKGTEQTHALHNEALSEQHQFVENPQSVEAEQAVRSHINRLDYRMRSEMLLQDEAEALESQLETAQARQAALRAERIGRVASFRTVLRSEATQKAQAYADSIDWSVMFLADPQRPGEFIDSSFTVNVPEAKLERADIPQTPEPSPENSGVTSGMEIELWVGDAVAEPAAASKKDRLKMRWSALREKARSAKMQLSNRLRVSEDDAEQAASERAERVMKMRKWVGATAVAAVAAGGLYALYKTTEYLQKDHMNLNFFNGDDVHIGSWGKSEETGHPFVVVPGGSKSSGETI